MGNPDKIKQGEFSTRLDLDQDVEVAIGAMIAACARTEYGKVSYAFSAEGGFKTAKPRQDLMTTLIGDTHILSLPDSRRPAYSAAFCP